MTLAVPAVLLAVLWCTDTIITRTECFNLETRLPIVKRGKLRDSYFGYSVAGHQSIDSDSGEVISWILVGAPLDKNLQPGTNRSGALWKCPLTSLYDDCEQVVTDGKRTDGQYKLSIESKDLTPPQSDEIKEGQWMGVIVRSQGLAGKVLVCAHRYMNRGLNYQWGQGLCYILNQALDLAEVNEPCKGQATDKGHLQFGYCQAGTSGVILEDDTVVIGSPGSYNWKGNLFKNSVSDNYLKRDNAWYLSPVLDTDNCPVDDDSYLGMSTTAAKFLGDQKMVYAAGAPRANGTGQVILFTIKSSELNLNHKLLMDVNLTIRGEQFASSFGYELATADLNGDKEPDLIVGAPFYFTKESGGAVYIYINDKNHCFNCNPPIRLVGKSDSRFGFAISNLGDLNKDGFDDIAVGAPYEGNGVIYVYQGSADGIISEPSQVIKAEDLVVDNLNIKIRTLGYSLSGNGMDLDQNGYPDLISGAYESDLAILIRARPIVNITTTYGPPEKLSNIDPTKTGCSANKTSSVTCFTFETCCSLESVFKAGSAGSEWVVQLHYKLEAETFQDGRKFSRVWFGPDHVTKSQTIENNVFVDHKNQKTCQEHTAYLKENTIDIQSQIALRISYSLVQNDVPIIKPGDSVPSLADYPVLNQNQAEKTFYATFHKDCGNNDECESDVHVNAELDLPKNNKTNEYKLVMGEHTEILLNTTAYNSDESAYECRMFISHPFSFNYIGTVKLDHAKQVDCNPFNKTLVICTLGNPFKRNASSNIQLRFDPKELNDAENQLEFKVFANSTSHDKNEIPIILRANVIKQAELSLKGLARPEQVFYGGQVKDDSSVKYRDEVGSRVLHTYQVFNSGPWKVSNLEVHIEWPYQVAKYYTPGKWLLYLDEIPYVEALSGGKCFMSQGQVNPLGLKTRPGIQEMPLDSIRRENAALNNLMSSKSTMNTVKNGSGYYQNRIRREQNYVVGAETYVKDNGKQLEIVKMNCLLGNAHCFKFRCIINSLQKNQEATIFIKARLWNSTLLQTFPKVDSVQIVSRAKIHVPSDFLSQQNLSDDEFEVETTAKVDLLEQQESIPMWIIILAILAGLLLLILLTLLLWRLGFFKRRRPDPTLSGNIEKHRVDDNYYDY